MKNLFLILAFLCFCDPVFAITADVKPLPSGIESQSFSDTLNEKSIEVTLSATPGNLTTVTLPDNAKGFKLFPRTNHVRFAVYYDGTVRTLAAVATDSDGTVAAADLAIGGIAKNDMWEVRLLPGDSINTDRILTLRSTTASVVVDLEVF